MNDYIHEALDINDETLPELRKTALNCIKDMDKHLKQLREGVISKHPGERNAAIRVITRIFQAYYKELVLTIEELEQEKKH